MSALRSLIRPTGRHRKRRARRFTPALRIVSVGLAVAVGVPLVAATAGTPGDRPASPPLAVAAPLAAAPRASTPAVATDAPPAQSAPSTTAGRRAPAAPAATRRAASAARVSDQAAEDLALRAAARPAARRTTPERADRSRREPISKPTPRTPVRTREVPREKPSVAAPRGSWVRPTSGVFTSGFKWRWGRQHKGIDIAAPIGTPIYAATDGLVVTAGWNGGYGKFVLIEHSDGVATAYGHNTALLVHPGQRVSAGQQITRMGSTGHSTGSHLHFEVRINGTQTDPIPYLARRGVRI
ncbi:MAG TPA: M23 family metallopeptidase [Mycobacteriales bacterium]|nr:M23 family metallopeptidase [Mycobacteriales bacterium]